MKYWVPLFFLLTNLQASGQVIGSEEKVTIIANSKSLRRVLSQLQEENPITFAYKNSLIEGQTVSIKISDTPLKEALTLLFENSNIGFTIKNNKVILFERSSRPATNFTVSGFVLDSISGEPLIGATIFNPKLTLGTRTDDNGFFSLSVPQGEREFFVSYIGFKKSFLKRNLQANARVSIAMIRKDNQNLRPVVISEKKDDFDFTDGVSLQTTAINALPSIGGEADVIRTMQLMPGIKSGTENASGLFVRGGAPEENLVLLDGIPIYKPTHLFGFLSVFNSDMLNKVELSKGGFKARYGGRLSSVLNISMKNGNIKKNSMSVSLSPLVSKIMVEGPLKKDKGSFILSYRRSFTDLYLNNWRTTETFYGKDSSRSQFNFYDFNAKLNYKLNNKNRLFLSIYNGSDQYSKQEISRDSTLLWRSLYDNQLRFSNQILASRWQSILSNKLISNVTLAFSRYQTNTFLENSIVYNTPDVFQYKQQAEINDKIAKVDLNYFMNKNNTVHFGVEFTNHLFQPENTFRRVAKSIDSTQGNSERINGNEFTAYLEDEWRWNKLNINAGLRTTFYNVNGVTYSSFQPRFNAEYQINSSWNIGGSYAQMAQFLHLLTNSNIGGAPTDLWILPTDRIRPQRNRQFTARVNYNPGNQWNFSIEAYHKKLSQLIAYKEGASLTQNAIDAAEKITTGSGVSQGIELLARKKKGKTTGWLGYTLSKSIRRFDAINNGEAFPYIYDSRHDASISLLHTFTKRLSASTSWVYSSGTPISIPTGRYAVGANQGSPPDFNKPQNLYYGERNNFRLQDYHRWDINLNYVIPTRWGQHSFHLTIYNIYNRFNTVFISRQLKVFEDKLFEEYKENALFPIIPSFTYKILLSGKEK